MEKKGADIRVFPHNYWCISCASLHGVTIEAVCIIWDEEEEKMIPLCSTCREYTTGDVSFFSVFSVN